MEAIPRIRRPKSVHTLDQVVGQAARLGWTIGITAEDLVGAQCRAVVGLGNAKDAAWRSGQHMVGVWYSSRRMPAPTRRRWNACPTAASRRLALSPLSGRLDPPDIALFYATPGAMIYFINGLQWAGYKRFDWSIVGEFGLRRFLGPRVEDARAEPLDPVLRRAPLWRRTRRRDADGAAARISAEGDCRDGGVGEKRAALPVPAIRHPAGRPRRDGGQLPRPRAAKTGLREVGRGRHRNAAAMLPPSTVVTSAVVLSASAWARKACATSSAVTSRPSRLPAR